MEQVVEALASRHSPLRICTVSGTFWKQLIRVLNLSHHIHHLLPLSPPVNLESVGCFVLVRKMVIVLLFVVKWTVPFVFSASQSFSDSFTWAAMKHIWASLNVHHRLVKAAVYRATIIHILMFFSYTSVWGMFLFCWMLKTFFIKRSLTVTIYP